MISPTTPTGVSAPDTTSDTPNNTLGATAVPTPSKPVAELLEKSLRYLARREYSAYELGARLEKAMLKKREQHAHDGKCRRDEDSPPAHMSMDEFTPYQLTTQERQHIKETLRMLATRGWQSDARFAEMTLRHRMMQGKGQRAVVHELATHRIKQDVVNATLATLPENAWCEVCEMAWAKKFRTLPKDFKTLDKQRAFLSQRGFAEPDWRHFLRIVRPDERP